MRAALRDRPYALLFGLFVVALGLKVLIYSVAPLLLLALIRRLDRTIGLVSLAAACLLMAGVVCWDVALLAGHWRGRGND